MSKILIDGRFVGVGDSMSRYVLETLRGILKLDQDNEYTLLLRPIGEKELKWYPEIMEANNLKVEYLDIPHYSFPEQTKLLSYLNKKKYDLVHFIQFNHPILYRGNFVVTIHDLILLNHSDGNALKKKAYKTVMSSAAKHSKKIIAVSRLTKEDIIKLFQTQESKIEVIYHGIDHEKFNSKVKTQKSEIDNFKNKYGIAGDYLLYVGAWKKHKNVLNMLKAFEECRSDLQLVLIGKIDQDEPEVIAEINRINSRNTKYLSHNTIITTGAIDVRDPNIPLAYAGAAAYIIPSLAEGFGWPPLEAMACGTPVISSNYSCMPEVLGDAALYFDPLSVEEMTEAIRKVLSDGKLRADLIAKGLNQVEKYNWSDTAKKTLEVYKSSLK